MVRGKDHDRVVRDLVLVEQVQHRADSIIHAGDRGRVFQASLGWARYHRRLLHRLDVYRRRRQPVRDADAGGLSGGLVVDYRAAQA